MARILCTLPFASKSINGVTFAATADGMLSEDVGAEVAAGFAAIPGYRIVADESQQTAAPAAEAATDGKRRIGRAAAPKQDTQA